MSESSSPTAAKRGAVWLRDAHGLALVAVDVVHQIRAAA